jgi:hypothetical protein
LTTPPATGTVLVEDAPILRGDAATARNLAPQQQ